MSAVLEQDIPHGLVICGSTRSGSFNRMLAAIAVDLGTEVGLELEPVAIDGLPLYNGDLEAASGGLGPAEVREHRVRVDAADLLVIDPEIQRFGPTAPEERDRLALPPRGRIRAEGNARRADGGLLRRSRARPTRSATCGRSWRGSAL